MPRPLRFSLQNTAMSSIPIHLESNLNEPRPRHASLLRTKWDAPLVALALLQGAALLIWPSILLIAISMWWGANTIAHDFIHRPFFSSRWLNRAFSFYLSLVLGIPQSLWRSRHLAHHAEREWKLRVTSQLTVEMLGVAAMWALIAWSSPRFFLIGYVPGYFCGLCLCWLQGKYEHARGTTSHYGRLYNFLFFNDGYHLEHHARPGVHWHELPHQKKLDARPSHWPAVFRWIEGILGGLERFVLISRPLQRFVLRSHETAFRKLLNGTPTPKRIGVVGGGLFPRSLMVLKNIYPNTQLVGIDGEQKHIDIARKFADAKFIHEWFDPRRHADFDLLVIPLAYVGDKRRLYQQPTAPNVLVHDWI